jgi:hypothetical protein
MAPRFFCSGAKYKTVSVILTVQISYILVRIVGAWLICRVTFPESQRIFPGMLAAGAAAAIVILRSCQSGRSRAKDAESDGQDHGHPSILEHYGISKLCCIPRDRLRGAPLYSMISFQEFAARACPGCAVCRTSATGSSSQNRRQRVTLRLRWEGLGNLERAPSSATRVSYTRME